MTPPPFPPPSFGPTLVAHGSFGAVRLYPYGIKTVCALLSGIQTSVHTTLWHTNSMHGRHTMRLSTWRHTICLSTWR